MYNIFLVGLKTWIYQSLHIVQIFKREKKKVIKTKAEETDTPFCLLKEYFTNTHFLEPLLYFP